MEIVSYDLKDSYEVTAFFREIFKEFGWEERPFDHMDKPHLLFHIPEKGLLLVAKDAGRVVGTAGVILLDKTEGLIKRFYITKTHRGTGLAQQLLGELMIKAKSFGINKLILDVSKDNSRAIRFYEKNGFLRMSVDPQDSWPESKLQETHVYFYKLIAS